MFETAFSFLLFLFSFLLTYALLLKIKIFSKRTSTIISIIIAFYFLSASVFYSQNLIQIFAYSLLVLFVALIAVAEYQGRKSVQSSFSGKKK